MRVNRRTLAPGQKIRVLVVDDSAVTRRLVAQALESDALVEVAGAAFHGAMALEMIPRVKPDVMTLDIEMPQMNGLETLKRVRREHPEIRVIMVSSLTERGAAITLEALTLGADDCLAKPAGGSPADLPLDRLRDDLLPRVKQFFTASPGPVAAVSAPPPAVMPATGPAKAPALRWSFTKGPAPVIAAIGVSTGGPQALETFCRALPANFPAPIAIVQHMPPVFTRMLAERLNAHCSLDVAEATDGLPLRRGQILLAPGNFHLRITGEPGRLVARLDQGPAVNSCRPAVDVLFSSLAESCKGAVAAAVLTGMGSDGLRGAGELKRLGAHVIAQDEATSVVWGMPAAVAQAGLADSILPLPEIAPALTRLFQDRGVAVPPPAARVGAALRP